MLHCACAGPISFLPAAALPRSPQCPYLIPQEETNCMCLCLDWQLEYVGDRPLKMRHNSKLFFIHCLLNREVHIFPETVVCLLQEKTISLPSAVVLFERGGGELVFFALHKCCYPRSVLCGPREDAILPLVSRRGKKQSAQMGDFLFTEKVRCPYLI